jgi:hypothetical protein
MTKKGLRELPAEWAEWTATEQGLPPRVTDIVILRHIARLFGFLDEEESAVE